jgi:hypothetical protein
VKLLAEGRAPPQFVEEIQQECGVERTFGLILGERGKKAARLLSGARPKFWATLVLRICVGDQTRGLPGAERIAL